MFCLCDGAHRMSFGLHGQAAAAGIWSNPFHLLSLFLLGGDRPSFQCPHLHRSRRPVDVLALWCLADGIDVYFWYHKIALSHRVLCELIRNLRWLRAPHPFLFLLSYLGLSIWHSKPWLVVAYLICLKVIWVFVIRILRCTATSHKEYLFVIKDLLNGSFFIQQLLFLVFLVHLDFALTQFCYLGL